MSLPVIDMAPLFTGDAGAQSAVAAAIARACEDDGFFYVIGHGVGADTLARLEAEARGFFALPPAEKEAMSMARGGAAWRGWFPFRGELTSARPDDKEGVYFGEELGADDARVRAGWPLHGAPQRKRNRADQGVQPPPGGWMAVDDLMLQRAVPGDQPAADRDVERPCHFGM
jgi:isopenicillin N synthase-like dioxygenase